MLSPPAVGDTNALKEKISERSPSVNSGGSVVGKNKVYIPSLNFPEDINADPKEKRRVFSKPVDDSRFALKKTSNAN